MGKKITGRIFSDLGHAASFMALGWVQKALRESVGFLPYPATLNLRLESPNGVDVWESLQRKLRATELLSPDASFCQARCFLVEIQGQVRGAVLVPDVEGYPKDKIEVIAPVRLKEALQVRDGDRITLEFVE